MKLMTIGACSAKKRHKQSLITRNKGDQLCSLQVVLTTMGKLQGEELLPVFWNKSIWNWLLNLLLSFSYQHSSLSITLPGALFSLAGNCKPHYAIKNDDRRQKGKFTFLEWSTNHFLPVKQWQTSLPTSDYPKVDLWQWWWQTRNPLLITKQIHVKHWKLPQDRAKRTDRRLKVRS